MSHWMWLPLPAGEHLLNLKGDGNVQNPRGRHKMLEEAFCCWWWKVPEPGLSPVIQTVTASAPHETLPSLQYGCQGMDGAG